MDPTANTDPRVQLQSLVDLSLSRSKQVGAAYLLKLEPDRMMAYLRTQAGLTAKARKAQIVAGAAGRERGTTLNALAVEAFNDVLRKYGK